jgi:hypothetical protein
VIGGIGDGAEVDYGVAASNGPGAVVAVGQIAVDERMLGREADPTLARLDSVEEHQLVIPFEGLHDVLREAASPPGDQDSHRALLSPDSDARLGR